MPSYSPPGERGGGGDDGGGGSGGGDCGGAPLAKLQMHVWYSEQPLSPLGAKYKYKPPATKQPCGAAVSLMTVTVPAMPSCCAASWHS